MSTKSFKDAHRYPSWPSGRAQRFLEQRSDYTAIGPTVNFAARIESASEAGAVYVSESVARRSPSNDESRLGVRPAIEGNQTLYRLVEDL